jgi:hypothetical protein
MDVPITLLFEENIISLRNAIVANTGELTFFALIPRSLELSSFVVDELMPVAWLYRRKRSFTEEHSLRSDKYSIERYVKPMEFERPPDFKLIWADSGQSAALLLNGEPWAFVDEENDGYSKGVLSNEMGKVWNQQLFDELFGHQL